MEPIDRSATARAVAKVIAYRNCGNDETARQWFVALARELGMTDMLSSTEAAA